MAGYQSKFKGAEVDAYLDYVKRLQEEGLDLSAYATKEELKGKQDKIPGKGLSTEDFTTTLKNKLNSLNNYDDAEIKAAIESLRSDFDLLVSGDTTRAIKSYNDIISFLEGIEDSESLDSIIAGIQQQIANVRDAIPTMTSQLTNDSGFLTEHQDISGKQDKIDDLDAIRSGAEKGATALQEVPSTYVTETELNDKMKNLVDEDGYVYSAGEKVDMRFTRSLLPVGTSIPASANLNTIEFLKIGKYYCSQNADAKTVKNCPTNMAFSMEVFNPLGTNIDNETTADYTYRLRVLTPYNTGIHYIQSCRTSGTPGTWTYESWYVTPRSKFTLASSKNDGTAAIGSTNKGVYIDSEGEIKAMSYTVGKSVPSSAVFTDTDTKVTAVGNHYAPAEDEAQQIDAPSGEVVTGIKRDAAGHVVGVVSAPQTGGGGGGAVNNVYYTDFGLGELDTLISGDIEELIIDSENLEIAIREKKRILVPCVDDGFAILCGESYGSSELYFSVVSPYGHIYQCECYNGVLYFNNIYFNNLVDNFVKGVRNQYESFLAYTDGFSSSHGVILLPGTSGSSSDDVLATKKTLKTINGESILGNGDINISGGSGGVKPYVTAELTVEELRALAENSEYFLEVHDKAAIKQALAEHRPIFVPQSQDESYVGYAVMCGYYEDLLYLQVISEAGELFIIDTDSVDDTPIYGNQVSRTALRNIDESIFGTYPILDSSDSTVLLPVNTYTVIVPVVSNMVDIRLEDIGRTDRTNECVVRFTVSSAAEGVELIVPDNVVWADGVLPAMTPGKTYEISFLSIFGNVNITATFLEF